MDPRFEQCFRESIPEAGTSTNQANTTETRTSGTAKTSEAKIKANRKNAKKSTGPRTPQGRRNSSRNAAKHGILVGEITALGRNERIEEFQKLHQDLVAEYEPGGRVEELLVERIATCFWKLKRVLRAEQGELTMGMTELGDRLVVPQKNDFKTDFALWRAMVEGGDAGKDVGIRTSVEQAVVKQKVVRNLQRTIEGVVMLKGFLQAIREEIQEKGSVSDEKRHIVRDVIGDDLELLLRDHPNHQGVERRTVLLRAVNQELAALDKQQNLITARDQARTFAELRRASIPPHESIDGILRYETHVERQLYRAMDQLERIQRKRRGESVPAPLRLDIGK